VRDRSETPLYRGPFVIFEENKEERWRRRVRILIAELPSRRRALFSSRPFSIFPLWSGRHHHHNHHHNHHHTTPRTVAAAAAAAAAAAPRMTTHASPLLRSGAPVCVASSSRLHHACGSPRGGRLRAQRDQVDYERGASSFSACSSLSSGCSSSATNTKSALGLRLRVSVRIAGQSILMHLSLWAQRAAPACHTNVCILSHRLRLERILSRR